MAFMLADLDSPADEGRSSLLFPASRQWRLGTMMYLLWWRTYISGVSIP